MPRPGTAPALVVVRDSGLMALAMILDLAVWDGDRTSRGGSSVPLALVLVSAAALAACLLHRARRPWTAFACAWVYTVGWEAVMPSYTPVVGLLLAVHTAARRLPLRRAVLVLAAAAAPLSLSLVNLVTFGTEGSAVLLAGLFWCVLVVGVWAAGRFGRLTQETAELRLARATAQAEVARLDERLRLAGDLHDVAAHSITAVVFQAAAQHRGRTQLDAESRACFAAIESTATMALRELRELLGLLHGSDPGVEDYRGVDELGPTLEMFRSCGLDVRVGELGAVRALPASVGAVVVRTVREALANALKHGGEGTKADVGLQWSETAVEVVVRSRQVRGTRTAALALAPELGSGLGLTGLQRRCTEAGGSMSWGWEGDDCYRVDARLPLLALAV